MGCPKCEIAMEVRQRSVGVAAMTSGGEYASFDSDLWHCPACGIQVVTEHGTQPIEPTIRIWLNEREKKRYEERHSGGKG